MSWSQLNLFSSTGFGLFFLFPVDNPEQCGKAEPRGVKTVSIWFMEVPYRQKISFFFIITSENNIETIVIKKAL